MTRSVGVVLALVLLALSTSNACTVKKLVADNLGGSMDDIRAAFYAEPFVRHAREGAPSLLLLLDGFLRSSPDNEELLAAGAEMSCSFAFGLVEHDDPAWAKRLYEKGLDYGLRSLAQSSERITAAVDGPIDELEVVLREDFDEEHVPGLFWTAFCWGSWINVNMDSMEAIAQLPIPQAIMARVVELDEGFFYGGPQMFFGMVNGVRPKFLGGDPDAARSHFERSFELNEGKFLLGQLYFAMSYAVQVQDRALYVKTLEGILAAPDDIDPDLMLLTSVAKQRAEVLLRQVGDKFVGEAPVDEPAVEDDELRGLLDD